MPRFVASVLVVLALCAASSSSAARGSAEWRSLDGSGNNREHPDWGKAGTAYVRVAPANYADGIATMVGGPSPRYVSNRIFNDVGQNLFSENDVTQWGWVWGQFLDHDFGLRDERVIEIEPIGFSAADPLESFRNDFNAIDFWRTPPADGTGVTTPRQVSGMGEQLHRRVERLRHLREEAGLATRRDGRRPAR
jgi:peroxidase